MCIICFVSHGMGIHVSLLSFPILAIYSGVIMTIIALPYFSKNDDGETIQVVTTLSLFNVPEYQYAGQEFSVQPRLKVLG